MTEALPIPEVFQVRKTKILYELSIPDAEYTDLSPKGSVDEGIRDLIGDINALPGLVTTSSCAGRISVFMEGKKKQRQQDQQESERQFAPSGGKGSGRWLFVSHDPFQNSSADGNRKNLHEVFGMVEGDEKMPNKALRLVRFSFEPMVGQFSFCRIYFIFFGLEFCIELYLIILPINMQSLPHLPATSINSNQPQLPNKPTNAERSST